MAKETDVNFNYIPNQRYIVEIKDGDTGQTHHSKRICSIEMAGAMKDSYNSHAGFTARIHDTKTGEVI